MLFHKHRWQLRASYLISIELVWCARIPRRRPLAQTCLAKLPMAGVPGFPVAAQLPRLARLA